MKTTTDIQIRFADVDMLGHVNNVNLQHYFDVGKNDFFRQILKIGMDWSDKGLVTASTHTDYLAQTRMEDSVFVETYIEKIGTTSLTVFQRLIDHCSGQVRAESLTVLVVFDFHNQCSIPVPEQWRKLAVGQ